MKYLLDTHTFLWKLADPKRVPKSVYAETEDPENEVLLSAISLWEIAIKVRKGKLVLDKTRPRDLPNLASRMGIAVIPLEAVEAASYSELTEATHFDPFDRILVWQAISRNLTLVSGDRELRKFEKDGLKLFWD